MPEEKIVVVYNAVAPEFLETGESDDFSEEEKERLREKYHFPKAFILYVGTLQPRKNLPSLIEAFAKLRDEDSEMGLVLVGNRSGHHGDLRIDEAITRFHVEGAVWFPGFVDQADLPRVMSLARVFAFPSRYEGFGIPALEAMSRGVPVVASDIPSLREACGDAALFVDLSDIAGFAKSLYTVCAHDDVRKDLVTKGRVRARFFSWKQSASELLALYNCLCFHKKNT